ncbi:MAG TPA: DUF6152 family protein [Chloroflexota bacterium]|nr:DUF6152 family protein [Chloroflexota bacterium]
MTRRTLLRSIAWTPVRAVGAALVLVAALLVGTIPGPALAHHGWSGYDSSTLLTLSGTITDVQYENPHVMVTLAVAEEEEEHAEGEVHEEEAEVEDPSSVIVVMAPPFRSESRGLARDMLYPGAAATFEGYLHKTTAMELRAERIIINGMTVELR